MLEKVHRGTGPSNIGFPLGRSKLRVISFGTCTFSKGIAEFVMNTYIPGTGELQEMKFKYTLTDANAFEAKMEGSDHVYKYTRK